MSGNDWKEKVALERKAKEDEKKQKAKANANVAVKVSTTGWRSQGNGYLFKLTVDDIMVSYYLKKLGKKLARTQNSDKFDFEFHPMHTTGCPVYIRMAGNTDNSLMTKFDTKNKSAPKVNPLKNSDLHNSGKISELSTAELIELQALIKDNFEFLQLMAKCIYEQDKIC